MRYLLKALFGIGGCLALGLPALADDLAGKASIIDGDTLEIHGTRIRLWGIDALESSQLCRGEDSLYCRVGSWGDDSLVATLMVTRRNAAHRRYG
jgi:endonuclease YncB( thermonuclease family)